MITPQGSQYRNMSDFNITGAKKPIIITFDLDDTLIRTQAPHNAVRQLNSEGIELPDYPAHYRDSRSECYMPIDTKEHCAYLPNEFYDTLKHTLIKVANISGMPVIPLIVTSSTENRAAKIIEKNEMLRSIFPKHHIFARLNKKVDINVEQIIQDMKMGQQVRYSWEYDTDQNTDDRLFKEDPLYQVYFINELKERRIIDFSKDTHKNIKWVHVGDNAESDEYFIENLKDLNEKRDLLDTEFIYTTQPDDQNEIYACELSKLKDIWETLKEKSLR